MFSEKCLHAIRRDEVAFIATYLPRRCRILELGAGDGYQGRELAQLGYEVSAIDIAASARRETFPVEVYDGVKIPFPDQSFDVVFSSNVLEHVADLPATLQEIGRVLKLGGYCVHTMPSSVWRFWTCISGPLDVIRLLLRCTRDWPGIASFSRQIAWRLSPFAHGAHGIAATELWTFNRLSWKRRLARHGLDIMAADSMRLFYTGWMFFGLSLPIRCRRALARCLGSSSIVYVVKPKLAMSMPLARAKYSHRVNHGGDEFARGALQRRDYAAKD